MNDESKIKIIQDPPKTSAIEEIPQDLKATTLSGLKELQNLLPHGDLGRIVNSFIFINHPDAVLYQRSYRQSVYKVRDYSLHKVFLVQNLCEHLLSRGNEVDFNTEYPRLNRHVHMVVKKSLSEYLNVKDQDQLELCVRMKNVASLWANDIIQQKIR